MVYGGPFTTRPEEGGGAEVQGCGFSPSRYVTTVASAAEWGGGGVL